MKRVLPGMKYRWLLFVIASLFQFQTVQAQTTVQIGFGNDVPTYTLYFPVYRYSSSSSTKTCRSNIVFTQTELAAAGITTGSTITAVAFNKVNQAQFLIPADYKLYMANSSNTSLSRTTTWADILTTHTEVFNSTSFNVQDAPGWNTINITPFVYSGGSLEIACDLLMTSGSTGATDNFQWEFTDAVPTDKIIADYTTTTTPPTVLDGTLADRLHRPNIKITYIDAAPCTVPPTAGNAISSATNVCNGEQFSLSLSGNSTGSGQTYQWQSSPDDATWTDIPGAHFPALVHTQSTSTYYRAVVTCSGNSVPSTSVMVSSPALVSGSFSINNTLATGGNNFASFADAINHIKCGVNGPVVFNVEPGTGPYTEQIVFPEIFGTSATNTITINGNGAYLNFSSSTSAERAGITLNGADHVIIDSLNIDGSAGTYGWGVFLTNAADSNTIKRCTIMVSTSSTSSNFIPVVISGSPTSATSSGNNGNYNLVMNNRLIGGYYGIMFYGQTTDYCKGNVSMNNSIQDFYAYAHYVDGEEDAVISGNDITRPTRSNSTSTSVAYVNSSIGTLIEKNRFHNVFGGNPGSTSATYAFYITGADATSAKPTRVINNLVYDIVSNGTIYGLYNNGSDSALYYHNTIVLDDGSTTTGSCYGIYQTALATGVVYKNNIIYITRGGTGTKRCIYLNNTSSTIEANNNVYWLAAPSGTDNMLGQYGTTDYATMVDWKNANSSAYDQASFFIDPMFQNFNPGEYKPTEPSINNIGENVGVLTDIYGVTRTPLPDPGAVEFTLDGCINPPTAGMAITSDAAPCSGASFTLNLDGNTSGAGQTYQWQWSTDDATWSNIGSVQTTPLFTTDQTSTHYYRAEVKCSGGTAVYSSSVYVQKPEVAGAYTINNLLPTGGTNFTNFSDAVAYLKCGITAPVVFTVEPFTGPYNEQVIIGEINGTSAANTVTFLGNGTTLYYVAPGSTERAALILDGADHVIIDSLNVDVTGGTSYGWGIVLTNQADSNIIRKCRVSTSTSSSSSNFSGILINGSVSSTSSSGNNGNYNLFENNTVSGGYYGFYAYGSSSAQNTGNRFINNKLLDHYYYGMYVYGQKQGILSKNDVSRPTRAGTSTSYGIYLSNCTDSMVVEKNRVHNMYDAIVASSSTCYSIYITNSDGNMSYPSRLENNLVHSQNNNSTLYGIYCTGDYWNIYHNTVVMHNTAATTGSLTRGIYASATGVDIFNNIVSITRGGTGTKTCLYLGTSYTGEIDRNDWWIASFSGTEYVAYETLGYTTINDWKLGNSGMYDQNSISADPFFQQLTPGNFYPTEPSLNDIGEDLGVATDILGVARPATPDPGAYEFTVAGCTNPPAAGFVTTQTIVCPNTSFTLDLSGNSAGEGISIQWQVSPDNATWTNIDTPMIISSMTVAQATSSYYRALVRCNGGTAVATAGVYVESPGLAAGGSYTINSTQPTGGGNFQSFGDAVSFIACGIAGPVTFNVVANTGPYNEQVMIPAVGNTSAINTVTWNGNGNMLYFNVDDDANQAVLTLDGADHMIFDSLVIDASLGTYGYGILLTGGADSNIVRRSTIMANTSSTSSNFGGIIMSGSAGSATTSGLSGNGNLFMNNRVTGGYYGISVRGGSSEPAMHNRAVNNTLLDFYYAGLYTLYSMHTTFSGNELARPTRTSTSNYGVYVGTSDGDILIEKNRLHNLQDARTSSATVYAFYLTGNGTAQYPNRLENNIVYNIKNGSSICYGVYATTADYWTLAHNSINLDDVAVTGGSTYGMYVYGNNGVYVYNNIVAVTRGGTGTKYCLYFSTTGVTASDNNVLYMGSTTGTNHIGYYSGAKTTLADWQTTGYGTNSAAINPLFTDPFTGNLAPLETSIYSMGRAGVGVTTDILGVTRSVAPTPGAYEMTAGLPVTFLELDATRSGADVTVTWATLTEINNKGFEVERSTDGRTFRKLGFAGTKAANGNSQVKLLYEFRDIQAPTGELYYRLKQLDNNGRAQHSNVVRVKGISNRRFDITNLFPNPSRRADISLLMSAATSGKVTLVVTDVAGKVLLEQNETIRQGDNTLKLKVRQLPAGTYFLRAQCSDGCESSVKKFVMQ